MVFDACIIRKLFTDFVRSWFDQKSYRTLDLCKKFENIIGSGIETKFIVLGGVRRSDPATDLLHAIGVKFEPGKLVAAAHSNIQPGAKGIWLSKACKVICDLLAIESNNLSGKGE